MRREQSPADFVLVGPDPRNKQRRFASTVARRSEGFHPERIRSRLSQIRRYTLANLDSLVERFIQRVSARGYASIWQASEASDAVGIISRVVGGEKVLATNRASVIDELRPCLESNGYRLIDTYLAGYPRGVDAGKVLNHYWQLPDVSTETAFGSFAVQRPMSREGRKDYTALLGVSAAASEDGSVCFLQHTSNIGTMLEEAHRLILVIGIEKIVRTRPEALFQARSMGTFGLESLVLDLKPPAKHQGAVDLGHSPFCNSSLEVHLIVLDNGRRQIARDKDFADLLTCISCHACAKHCPTHSHFSQHLWGYPKGYLWAHLIGLNPSLDLCLECGMCVALCPLRINIPHLVSLARQRLLANWQDAINSRVMFDAWPLLRALHLSAPIANALLRNRWVRPLIERSIGFRRDAWVPEARHRTFVQWSLRREQPGKRG